MERARNPANMSVQISLTNQGKHEWVSREKPYQNMDTNKSYDRSTVHKSDIKRLEDKIKELDREIKETENKRKAVNRCNSISTHETEFDEDSNVYQTPVPERKSMPVKGVKNTLGQIRGIITHMVDLVNKDPKADTNLSSELSSLVKIRAELRSDKETPDVIKTINSLADKTPNLIESIQSLKSSNRGQSKKRAQSKYEAKRDLTNHYPRHRKVWKEDLMHYSNYSNNSLCGKAKPNKRQKTVEGTQYLSYSEREDSPIKFRFRHKEKEAGPSVQPFYIP